MPIQKTLARIRPTRGLSFDVPPWEVGADFYNRVQNVLIRNGFASRIPGRRVAYDPLSAAPYHIQNMRDFGTNFWIYYGLSTIHSVNGGTHTVLTPAATLSAITKPSQWSSTMLNGFPVMTNGIEAPHYWSGEVIDDFEALPGWPASTVAALMVAFKYHLFALDITVSGVNNPNLYLWSDAAEPGTIPQLWTPAPSNEAGSNTLSDRPGRIITARTLRDALIIYKENSAYTINYIGGNDKFSARGLWSKVGALSPRSVDDANGKHIVVTDGDIVLSDGYSEPQSIANALVKNFLFAQISDTSYEALQVIYDQSRQDVWIMFPESGEDLCTIALVYNMPTQAWGVVELTDIAHMAMGSIDDQAVSDEWDDDVDTWDTSVSSWNQASLSSGTESLVFAKPLTTELVQHDTDDAHTTDALIAKYSMAFDEPERVKFIRKVHIRGSAFTSLLVRVGSQMFPEDAITWSTEYEITSPAQPVPLFAIGRYISIEIRSEDSSVWTVTGFDMEVELRGFY